MAGCLGLKGFRTMSPHTPEMLAVLQAHVGASACRQRPQWSWLLRGQGVRDVPSSLVICCHCCACCDLSLAASWSKALLLSQPCRYDVEFPCRAATCVSAHALAQRCCDHAGVVPAGAAGRPMMWGTPGAEGGMPGMEMTPNGGMMMDPNAVGEGALSGGRPAKGTPLYCMLARGAAGGLGACSIGLCLLHAVLSAFALGIEQGVHWHRHAKQRSGGGAALFHRVHGSGVRPS